MGTSPPSAAPPVDQRLDELEKRVAELKDKPKDGWEIVQIIVQCLTPFVVFYLGYYLIDTVKAGFEQRRLSLENAKEMRELLLDLGGAGTTLEKAEADSVTLSAFGSYAINPLIIQLDEGQIRAQAAEKGLRAVWRSEPVQTCAQLTRVIQNRSGLHRWDTHATAIRLLGDLSCDSLPALRAYSELLDRNMPPGDANEYRRVVQTNPPPSAGDLKTLRDNLKTALEKVQEAKGNAGANSVPGGN